MKKNKTIILILLILSVTLLATLSNAESDLMANIFLTIHEDYAEIEPSGEVLASIKLLNLANIGRIDVVLDFKIKNSNDETIYHKQETVAIETQATFIRTFKMPNDAESGQYVLEAKVIFVDGKEATAKSSFVVKKQENNTEIIVITIALLVVLIMVYLTQAKIRKRIKIMKLKMKIKRLIKQKTKSHT